MKQSAAFFAIIGIPVFIFGMSLAHAAEFQSVGTQPAVLYDAPSYYGHKVFIAPAGMPVEVILTQDGWSKIRDASGDLSWVEANALTTQRSVVVTATATGLYVNPDQHSSLLATLERGVLLTWLSPAASGWLKVMHRDGETGFLKAEDVWGD
jgi:SH3-like domain-containing protein